MKRKAKLMIGLLVLNLIIFNSCKDDEIIQLNKFELSESVLQLGVDEIQPITIDISPDNATNPNITWVSSNEQVAVVQYSENGLVAGVKGISLGETVLMATSIDGNKNEELSVSVIVKIESIELEEEVSSNPSETTYHVIFTPENASIKTVTWSSSDSNVASVVNGVVTALSPGVTVITATTTQGEITASVEIAVSGNPPILGLQYCSTSGSGGYNSDAVITTGADANINYAGPTPSGNYEYYESETLIVQPDGTFDLTVTNSNGWSRSIAWIDWNGDKDFEDDGEMMPPLSPEAIYSGDDPISYTITINVPGDASPGLIRMRILTGDAWSYDDASIPASPCGELANSTIKDFNIEIGGTAYCSVSGSGGYNSDAVITTGGDTNINYNGMQPSGNYEFYTSEALSLASGGSFDLTVTNSNGWSRSIAWIDWNADGDFDDDGEMQTPLSPEALYSGDDPISYTITIGVPSGLATGMVRMRILTGDAWSYDDASIPASPCGELANSTIKDFNIKIL